MNFLSKINLATIIQKIGVFRSSLLLLMLVALCIFLGYRMGNYFHGYQSQALSYHKKRLALLYTQQAEQIKRINTLEVELEVEKIASQKSLSLLKKVEVEHYQLKKELAFYEKIMAPEKEADGVVIDDFILSKTDIANRINFSVFLIQQSRTKRYAKGFIDIDILGSLNNKAMTVKLSDISALAREDVSFSFKYFQVIEGVFTLPEGFLPEKVKLAVTLPKGRWQKYHRLEDSFQWNIPSESLVKSIPVILD